MNKEHAVHKTEEIEVSLQNQCTFFRPDDLGSMTEQILSAKNNSERITLVAICCPWMDDNPALVPYAYEGEGTAVFTPRLDNTRITHAAKRINTISDMLKHLGVEPNVALSVSNVQPQIHRLIIEQPNLIECFPDPIRNYVLTSLSLVNVITTQHEIEERIDRHAKHLQKHLSGVDVTIHNHLNLVSRVLAGKNNSDVNEPLIDLIQWMSQLDLSWTEGQQIETFLEALYIFDLLNTPSAVQTGRTFIWINMQPDASQQTRIINKALNHFGPYPIIRGFQYEKDFSE